LSDGIGFKRVSDELYLRGTGSLNARNCDGLKSMVFSILQERGVTHIYIDLSCCTYMDSTFLGLIVGMHKKLKQSGSNGLVIVNPSDEAEHHLSAMGLDQIIPISKETIAFPDSLDSCTIKSTENPKDILAAHKNLMDLSPENRERFRLLTKMLEQRIQQGSHR
jgi:anti-anti-sigma factor